MNRFFFAVAALVWTACQPAVHPASPVVPALPPPEPPKPEIVLEVQSSKVSPDEGVALGHTHRSSVDHLRRMETLKAEGDLAGALTEARRAVFDQPTDETAVVAVGNLALMNRDRRLAVQAFKRLGHLRSDDSNPLITQARLLISLKDHAEARKVGLAAVARDPSNPETYHVVGRAELSAGHLPEAIAQFQQVLELAPDHGYALNNLGFAYLRANRNKKAVEVLSDAVELLPQVAYIRNNLGVALERVGRIEEAQDQFALSTSLSPKYLKAQLNSERIRQVAQMQELESLEIPLPVEGHE